MNYITYFYLDKEVALLPESDVMLGDYENFSLEDWKQFGDKDAKVMAIYDNEPYDACVIMVVPNAEDDCDDLLSKLRQAISVKKFTAKSLIKFCGSRVKSSARIKVNPIQVC